MSTTPSPEAVSEQLAASAPADYAVVPVDPPLAMAKAFRDADIKGDRFLDGYAAMLAAAPSAPQQNAPEAPASAQPVARVVGSDTVIGRERRSLEWAKGAKPFDIEPGTLLYAQPVAAAPTLRDIVLEEAACAVESRPCSRDDHSTILRCVAAIRAKIAAPAAPVAQATTASASAKARIAANGVFTFPVNEGCAPAPSRDAAPLTKAQIDAIVYQCRQSGDDSTYAVVNASIAARAKGGAV